MVGFFAIVALLLAALFGYYWRWRRRVDLEINEGVDVEWAHFQKHEPEFLEGMTKEQFRDVYARVHTPRFPGYALAAVVSFFAALPVTFALLAGGLLLADALGLTPRPANVADRLLLEDDGQIRFLSTTPPEAALYYLEDLGGFYYFFGVIFIWLLIVAFFMHRYHTRRPGYLRDEIIRARP